MFVLLREKSIRNLHLRLNWTHASREKLWHLCLWTSTQIIAWASAQCLTYCSNFKLFLECWFTNLEHTPLKRCQQISALYKTVKLLVTHNVCITNQTMNGTMKLYRKVKPDSSMLSEPKKNCKTNNYHSVPAWLATFNWQTTAEVVKMSVNVIAWQQPF